MLTPRDPRNFAPGDILEPTLRDDSDANRALEELAWLEDHGIRTCLWGDDALRHYYVPTCVFQCLFVLVPDNLVDAAVECLAKTGKWQPIPHQPNLARTFEIPVRDLHHHVFSSLRMLQRSQTPGYETCNFMFVIVPAKSFANFTIDDTTMVLNTKIPIPTYAALLDSLIDTVILTGQVRFAPTSSDKDKMIAHAIFRCIGLWYNYLMIYNKDYRPFIPEVISVKNKPIVTFLELPMAGVSPRHWPKLCQLRGIVLPRDAIEQILRDDRIREHGWYLGGSGILKGPN